MHARDVRSAIKRVNSAPTKRAVLCDEVHISKPKIAEHTSAGTIASAAILDRSETHEDGIKFIEVARKSIRKRTYMLNHDRCSNLGFLGICGELKVAIENGSLGTRAPSSQVDERYSMTWSA
jgi:hypothetical protein